MVSDPMSFLVLACYCVWAGLMTVRGLSFSEGKLDSALKSPERIALWVSIAASLTAIAEALGLIERNLKWLY